MGEGERVDSFPSQPTLSITHPSIIPFPVSLAILSVFLSLDPGETVGKELWMLDQDTGDERDPTSERSEWEAWPHPALL